MMRSKIIIGFLCLALLTSGVSAQDGQLQNSDRLKKKIEEVESAAPKSGSTLVNLTYKRTLLRRYAQYILSLQQDIEDLRKIRATLDDTDSDGIKEIDADIERVTKEHVSAVEKARALRGETQEDAITQHAPATSLPMERAQMPCPWLTPEGKTKMTEDEKDKEPVGVIWCWEKQILRTEELAERVAPILWFSPDEPLRKAVKQIPQALPGDDSVVSPVVYYRISYLVPNRGVQHGEEFIHGEELDLTKIKGLTLKYYLYYSKDEGFSPHDHDLESARFDVHFTLRNEKGAEGTDSSKGFKYYVAQISRVVGAAHGVSWFDNILDIEKYTSLPITLLVEEGKHATCPDRNADGSYTPGYDVNRRFNDAWGVRDVIATGEVGGVGYEASKTKPRNPDDLIMVAPNVVTDDLLHSYIGSKSNREKLKENPGYKLRRVTTLLVKELEKRKFPNKDTQEFMDNFVKEQGETHISHHTSSFERAVKFGYGIERREDFLDALTFSYRYDGGHGFSFSPPIGRFPIPVFGGYVLPKANLILFGKDRRYSLEAMYTPSAARSFDWYASIGSEWFRPEGRDFDAKFSSEGGVKFRLNKGPFLLGGRVGLRTTARDPRVIFELGTGAF